MTLESKITLMYADFERELAKEPDYLTRHELFIRRSVINSQFTAFKVFFMEDLLTLGLSVEPVSIELEDYHDMSWLKGDKAA